MRKILILAVSILLVVSFYGNVSASTICPSGLIAYWSFDEEEGSKVYDLVGGNDGDIWGGGTRIKGVVGGALELDGVNDWVDIKFDDLDGANAFTIMFWVLPNRLPFDDYQALFWKGTFRKSSPYILGNIGSSNLWISVDTTALDNDGDFTTANQLIQNQWNQIAVTWDGTNIYAYINGVKDPSTDTTEGNVLVADQHLRLGYAWGSLFDGSLDEYSVFNRALSEPEIQRFYQNNLNGKGYCEEVKDLACVGFEYPMDSGAVTVKKNRVLPLKVQFLDMDGNMVTDHDIAAPPVLQVHYDSYIEEYPVDVTDDVRSAGKRSKHSKGNQFAFSKDSNWELNLDTKKFTAQGTYTLSIVTGNDVEYGIVPMCEVTFVVE